MKDDKKVTTEEKILKAARKVFVEKGFSATRTRDIAQEAGINVALLNYYFNSKENLLRIVVEENFKDLFSQMLPILADKEVPIKRKVEMWVERYYEFLLVSPDIPLFILHEIKSNNKVFESMLQNVWMASGSTIEEQLAEIGSTITVPDFIMNIVGITLMPFMARPLLVKSGLIDDAGFMEFVLSRKSSIPEWIMKVLK